MDFHSIEDQFEVKPETDLLKRMGFENMSLQERERYERGIKLKAEQEAKAERQRLGIPDLPVAVTSVGGEETKTGEDLSLV